ncbi:EamA family transporter [Haliscomenobacter sp.]|uniref:EamA family transporter n=1 Tax=Haliscomenobacter sp. TaxID=2717303 RepID=UPI0033652357
MRERYLIIASFATVYLVWGSTYLVNYLAIREIPPFLMSGTRFLTAGLLLFGVAALRKIPWPSLVHWKNSAWAGFMFMALGTGLVVWAEQWVDSGMAALLVSFEPLVVVVLLWIMRGQNPQLNSLLGVALGVLGMFLLVGQPQISTDRNTLIGVAGIAFSLLAWGYASIYIGQANLPTSKMQSAGMQMMGGGVSLLAMSFIFGDYKQFAWENLTGKGIFSFFYLVVLGSLLAFSAFNYLLSKVSPEKVATTNYVNPVVAMFLGWSINNEQITTRSLLAAAVMLTGVFFINGRFVKKMK